MGWKRLPSHFVNFPLRLLPLTPKQQNFVNSTGSLKEIVFKTVPSVGKFEIRQYLERIYGLTVKDIRTLNVEGKKKRTKYGYYRRTDYKKAYVTLKEPAPAQGAIRRKEEDQPNS